MQIVGALGQWTPLAVEGHVRIDVLQHGCLCIRRNERGVGNTNGQTGHREDHVAPIAVVQWIRLKVNRYLKVRVVHVLQDAHGAIEGTFPAYYTYVTEVDERLLLAGQVLEFLNLHFVLGSCLEGERRNLSELLSAPRIAGLPSWQATGAAAAATLSASASF